MNMQKVDLGGMDWIDLDQGWTLYQT